MRSKGQQQVCAACTHNCLSFHGTNKTSPTSFFKVMAKEQYFKILYIPPDFSSTLSDLINKKITLKDSSGKKWKVKVSKVDGSFAFEEGWSVFSLDHGLKVGYLLVFNYIKNLHFDVKIYDTSSCERLDFSEKRNKRKSRGSNGSPPPVREGMLVRQRFSFHVPETKSQHREDDLIGSQDSVKGAQLMGISEHHEDPCYLISPEFEDKERDDQNHHVDETVKIANGDSEVSNVDYGSHIYEIDAGICNEDPKFEGILGTGAAFDASELEMSGRNISFCETDKSPYDKSSTLELEENKENEAIMSNGEAQECQSADGLAEMNKVPVNTPKLRSSLGKLHATGKVSKKCKKELVTPDELGATGLPKEIKGAFGHCSDTINQDNESHFKPAATLSCVVPNDNNDYLKLPTCLPLICRGRVSMGRMVVLLRDPLKRLWPVLYHEQPAKKVLGHGWLDFNRANNIQPADECIFEAVPENKSERILAVHIVHR